MKLMGLKVLYENVIDINPNSEEYTAANILNREFKKEYEPMALLLKRAQKTNQDCCA